MSGYVSPYGKPQGLAQRLADWPTKLSRDSTYPWVGTGLLEDLKLAARILNLQEFAEHLRVNGTPEQQRFADEILRNAETLEALDDAASRVQALPDEKYALDPVATIERLDEAALAAQRDYRAVRDVLVATGALGADDQETPVADLLRALLS